MGANLLLLPFTFAFSRKYHHYYYNYYYYYYYYSSLTGTPLSDGTEQIEKTLLYIPCKGIIKANIANLNPRFGKLAKLWSTGQFVSVVITRAYEDCILASETGNAFGSAENGTTYDVYRYEPLNILAYPHQYYQFRVVG